MKVMELRFLLSLAAVLFGTLPLEAQTNTPYSYPYSALYVDASQFCANGFNSVLHGCNPPGGGTGANTGMWEAIAAAAASPFNISGVIDARAFTGTQLVTQDVGTTALYGCSSGGTCANMGTQVNGVLLLGDVSNLCDGPSAGYYTDSATGGGSNYGTPCIIVPWGFQIIGTAPLSSTFTLCTSGVSPCSNAFPKRAYGITGITVISNTQLQYNFPTNTFTTGGGPTHSPPQNIYPASTATNCMPLPTQASGELVAITGVPAGYNFLRTVECATSSSLQIAVPYSTTYMSCSGSCGTAYLVTPLIGFGVQGTSVPYEPVRTGSNQSFGTRLINLLFDLGTYQGAVAAQNLNGGEQSAMDTIYCEYPSMGCVQVGPGANESGPYNNIRVQNFMNSTNLYPTTFGIYNGSAGAGFHRFTMTLRYSGTPIQPTAAIYDDGSNVVFDGEPHNEGTVDTIDIAPNTSVAGVTVNGIVGPPSTSTAGVAGMNLVHVLKDGYSVTGSIFSNLTQQQLASPFGSIYALADDIHGNNVSDAFLSRYEFDNSGNPVSGATSQSNVSLAIPSLNGSGYSGPLIGPVSDTSGTITPGYLATYTASGTVGNCPNLPCNPIIGVFTSALPPVWVTTGETTVELDVPTTVSYNDILCASATSAGTAHDNGSVACTTGQWVGIATKSSSGSTSTPTALIVLK